MSCELEHADGAYVLGALSPQERADFEQHLAGCESCARSVRELAGLPGLLARVPVEVLDPGPDHDHDHDHRPPPVPDTLLPALVRRIRQQRRRRTFAGAGLVAASVLAASVAVGVTLEHHDATTPPPGAVARTAPPQALQPVGAQPISGWVSLTKVGWGTRLDLTCSYAGEQDAYADGWGVSYTMTVVRTDGSTEQVSSWRALPGETMRISAGTATDRAQIARVVVRTAAGREVLRLVTG
jgi:hypothetical protein